ncbi:hypothetical protein NDU88_006364 [Pleurodeles waltl]|uniref:Uncharacterized protein n=1 Tax=Pleurodeles waltl TaxID=8319 RepID=A0AAV7TYC5_PLEWA|nr:hypothetical protein NDU88_006364 [Pleurodeles waltl]
MYAGLRLHAGDLGCPPWGLNPEREVEKAWSAQVEEVSGTSRARIRSPDSQRTGGREAAESVVSQEVVQEAQKACLRGQIISYVKRHREKSRQKIWDLDGRILDLGGRLTSLPQDRLLRDLTHMQTPLRQELTKEEKEAWKATSNRIYQ